MKTLIACDLDGTLLRSDKTMSRYTEDVINRYVSAGGCFCYASARSLITARAVTKGLECPFPVITYNGTFIRDNSDGRILLKNTFDQAYIRDVIMTAVNEGVYPVVYSLFREEEKYFYIPERLSDDHRRFVFGRKGDVRDTPVSRAEELLQGEIFYLSFIDAPERLLPLYERFKDSCRCLYQKDTYEDFMWLELMPHGAAKASAVKALAKMLGCDRIISFGDGLNDLDMFEISDVALAVSNANEQLKAKADQVIPSNDDDAVAKWIEENML